MIRKKRNSGFTLVELMIVLVVIAIVASIATMSGLAARVRTNEGSVLASLKTISVGAEMYLNNSTSYPADLLTLGSDYIPSDLVTGRKSGYTFELSTANSGATFTVSAVPISMNYTGVKSYCINNLNAIYVYQNAPALSADGTNCPSGGNILSA